MRAYFLKICITLFKRKTVKKGKKITNKTNINAMLLCKPSQGN